MEPVNLPKIKAVIADDRNCEKLSAWDKSGHGKSELEIWESFFVGDILPANDLFRVPDPGKNRSHGSR